MLARIIKVIIILKCQEFTSLAQNSLKVILNEKYASREIISEDIVYSAATNTEIVRAVESHFKKT